MAPPNATETMNKPISTTKQDEKKDDDLDAIRNKKESLWKDSFQVQTTNKQEIIQMMGLDQHVVFARVVSNGNTNTNVTVSDVVHAVVDETKKRTAKDILQYHKHVSVDSVPNADTLWTLGSIWLVNETHYLQRHDAHAKRLQLSDQSLVPNWLDETVRVHTVPDTFFNADEFEWDKYSKSLLLEHSIRVVVKGEVTHVPVAGLANDKDGVIVYENNDLGFMVIAKPDCVPVHATTSNHTQDVISKLKASHPNGHFSVPQSLSWSLETDMSGLLAVSTKHEFNAYLKHQYDDGNKVTKTFKVLVCIKNENVMDKLEQFQKHGTVITHYVDPKSAAPKQFFRHVPKHTHHEWRTCQLKIKSVGGTQLRAACVSNTYHDKIDSCLAHYLWGPNSTFPKDNHIEYVMELQVELETYQTYQLRGQLAALGCPIVGDVMYGGGKCDAHGHFHHEWNRMAAKCCRLQFHLPQWQDTEGEQKHLVATEDVCEFELVSAWWTRYLSQYESYHQDIP